MVQIKMPPKPIDNSIGYLELKNNNIYCSKVFLSDLGYSTKNKKISLEFFLSNLIHKDDSHQFRNNYFSFIKNSIDFRQSMLIESKNGKYKEFVCTTNHDNINFSNNRAKSKFLFFNKRKYKTNKKVKRNQFYYKETAEMTSTGSWYVDLVKRKSYWDQQTRRILEYPEDYIPSINKSVSYYPEAYFERVKNLFLKCSIEGESFNSEIKMLTKNNREFWVKVMGKPVFNDKKKIIGVRGIFQDIDETKAKELSLQRTSNIIASQNKRLFNFAHIVSHNLRSHTSNLSLVVELINATESKEEKLELINTVEDIASSLNDTIEHLNEVVTIQTSTNKSISPIKFSESLKHVKTSIGQIITKSRATINSDFSKIDTINYIPAYLESILLNLITNSIKYKHPERDPVIKIRSYVENSKTVLEITDNGVGIDLEKFGGKLFGMYKTFHYNKDAVGIGLFITKNQIEALNGEINVFSEVEKFTTFKITF
ncbi:PAS domain-containing sensor histidine kinase [Flavivirga abyssicola]|uniref:PAS domain-containing sensor histidine kinase n=1 Tax=Flavivirga abyssicola TaxID=3063533 RepID=UPI0026DFF2A4|nr:PAS domain-containing sensor histidine kinase [Flavivirga sp. MEBiC07777]WVK14568.1 PAS domain-containing sensor histidine kinase [Flavivirga sp. MEBiC07777]